MFLAGAAVAAAAILYLSAERSEETIAAGRAAPAFELASLDGGTISLAAQRGRVVFLNFWATWCKPCEDEMPAMERLYQELGGDRFEMIAVAVGDQADDVRAFRDRLGLSFPIVLDPNRELAARYQSFRFPETYWIDPDGVLLARFIGPREWDATTYVERLQGALP
ncbi:MAG: TlpA family protein disulfide reductase [Myxococcales bacterium]|nr:TlpA family protein disulfide reductase [Myxococcales bacterium]